MCGALYTTIRPTRPSVIKAANIQPDSLLKWMAGLADPSRIRLLRLLERHELGVSDLCEVLQMPQSTVSRHLKLLGDEGWTSNRRRGTTNLYRMLLDELDPAQRDLWLLTRRQTESWATFHQDQVRLMRRLTDRKPDSQAFFAGAAGQWDRTRQEMYGRGFERDAILGLLPATWTVADLGCGTGAMAANLARCVHRVIAIDSSQAMLDAARQRLGGLSNVELQQADLEALPIDDASCDAALAVLVLTYIDEPAAAIAEMGRILKPGGQALLIDLLRHDRDDFRREMGQLSMGFEPTQLQHDLEAAGLTRVTCRPLAPEPDAKGPALLLARGTKN